MVGLNWRSPQKVDFCSGIPHGYFRGICAKILSFAYTHRIHVWYIYLDLYTIQMNQM